MKGKFLLALLVVAMLIGLSAPMASAQGPNPKNLPLNPDDIQLVAAYCSGSGLIYGFTALQSYETWWGFKNMIVTLQQWILTYGYRMNEFAESHGCPALVENVGEPSAHATLFVKELAPYLRMEYNYMLAP